jgi:hypothetical protein
MHDQSGKTAVGPGVLASCPKGARSTDRGNFELPHQFGRVKRREIMSTKADIQNTRTSSSSSRKSPEADARGQSEDNHKGGTNQGISSANPRVLSGKENGDATFPLKRKK